MAIVECFDDLTVRFVLQAPMIGSPTVEVTPAVVAGERVSVAG